MQRTMDGLTTWENNVRHILASLLKKKQPKPTLNDILFQWIKHRPTNNVHARAYMLSIETLTLVQRTHVTWSNLKPYLASWRLLTVQTTSFSDYVVVLSPLTMSAFISLEEAASVI